jgi:soluble lytic murein transglycosylase
MRWIWASIVIAFSGSGCARSAPGDAQPGGSSPGVGRALEKSAALQRAAQGELLDVATAVGPKSATWIEAVRLHRWAEAAKLMDALEPAERSRAGVRFARARVATKLGDNARAVKELTELEKELPLLGGEIARDRARAQLEAGPYEPAAKYYLARSDPDSLINAALACERAGQPDRAQSTIERALAVVRREKDDERARLECRARAVRARLAEKRGDLATAAGDLRWIATSAPTAREAEDADVKLEKLAPKRALTAKERYDRAWSLAELGEVERTERELGLLAAAPGPAVSQADVLRARGWALYSARREYAKSAELLEQAAKLGSRDPARDLFYAARARSRAHDDDRAIRLYKDLASRYPGSYWAEQGRYLAARLQYIAGRWGEASTAYDAYLKRYGKKGKNVSTARHEQAVAWLAGGQHGRAAKALAALADDTKSEHEQAMYLELAGIAEDKAGNRKQAGEKLRRVIKDAPLSFAALAAATRLGQMGESVPVVIATAPSSTMPAPLNIKLPAKVRLYTHLGLDDDAEDELALHEEQLKRSYAPRSEEALCQAYASLSSAARRYKVGQRAARWSLLTSAPNPATRWLWDCIYPRPYEPLVRDAEREQGLPANFVYAVMRQESGFRPSVVSPANAVGLLQLIPPTARNVAGELGIGYEPSLLESPPHNIRMGSYYLKKVLGTFGGNIALAAAAYNAGPAAVSRWLEGGEKLPLDVFVARIPYAETRQYVARVVGNLARYAYLEGGADAVPRLALEIEPGLRAPADAY